MNLNEKCIFLHQGNNNFGCQDMLVGTQLESSCEEKDLEILVGIKLNTIQQCALALRRLMVFLDALGKVLLAGQER